MPLLSKAVQQAGRIDVSNSLIQDYLRLTTFRASAHVKTHTRPYRCHFPGCGFSFGRNSALNRHFDTVHIGTRYYCDVVGCKYGLATNGTPRVDSLERHIENYHGAMELARWIRINKGPG